MAGIVKAGYSWIVDGNFADLNPKFFTHLYCAFANVDSSNKVIIPEVAKDTFTNFSKTVKGEDPSVRTLLSIGGIRATLASMASSRDSRLTFIQSSTELARELEFDGLDLFWRSPTTEADMTNLRSLLEEWNDWLESEEVSTGRTKLLLTAAVFPVADNLKYPTLTMSSKLDWVNVMAIDFTDPTKQRQTTGAPAALKKTNPTTICGHKLVKRLSDGGLGAEKLVLSLQFYGYAWKLTNQNQHDLGSAAYGPYSEAGFPPNGLRTYKQIKEFLDQHADAGKQYESTEVTNYFYRETLWAAYDGLESIAAKISYAKENGLYGYVAWTVGRDSSDWELASKAHGAY